MRTIPLTFAFVIAVSICQFSYGQGKHIDKVKFFTDEKILQATLIAPMSKVINHAATGTNSLPGRFVAKEPDSTIVSETIQLDTRGHFRRDFCYMPPLKIIFNKKDSSYFSPFKSLKLVSTCKPGIEFSQYLLQEYIVYKIYNLITEKSFRVRLLNLDYVDSMGKKKPYTDYAFLIEDEKDMAKRNGCKVWSAGKINTEATDRKQTTIVALFEYMIGNTDWAVPPPHNINLIQSKTDSTSKPFAIPYDFDYCGLVNTTYAIPDPILNTESVLQRVYRGFPRTMGELDEALTIFKQQKENIYSLINNFELLNGRNKKMMTNYLDDFFDLIKKPSNIKEVFIDNARKQ